MVPSAPSQSAELGGHMRTTWTVGLAAGALAAAGIVGALFARDDGAAPVTVAADAPPESTTTTSSAPAEPATTSTTLASAPGGIDDRRLDCQPGEPFVNMSGDYTEEIPPPDPRLATPLSAVAVEFADKTAAELANFKLYWMDGTHAEVVEVVNGRTLTVMGLTRRGANWTPEAGIWCGGFVGRNLPPDDTTGSTVVPEPQS